MIGSLIDSEGDEDRVREIGANESYAARYCDAYLRRYEMGGGAGFHAQMSYGKPVMLLQTVSAPPRNGQHGHRHRPECATTVREEWVEAEYLTPEPPARRINPIE